MFANLEEAARLADKAYCESMIALVLACVAVALSLVNIGLKIWVDLRHPR